MIEMTLKGSRKIDVANNALIATDCSDVEDRESTVTLMKSGCASGFQPRTFSDTEPRFSLTTIWPPTLTEKL